MRFLSFAVFTNLVMCVPCWVSEKCWVYEDYLNDVIVGDCPKSNLTARCRGVSDVALDLAEIPAHLEVLCLHLTKNSSLYPYSLSRFPKLTTLHVERSIFSVLPGAFKSLTSLHDLQIKCFPSTKLFLSSETLGDLSNLTTLAFIHCRLLSMAIDAFKGIRKLEKLILINTTDDFSDLLCRLTFASKSLNHLYVNYFGVILLRQTNCTFSNGTSFDVKFHRIDEVYLNLMPATILDKTVLKYFQKISFLDLGFTEFDVLQSEIPKVDHLRVDYLLEKVSSLEEICETAHAHSISEVDVNFIDITDSFVPDVDRCMCLERFSLNANCLQDKSINLTFINVLRNLTSLTVRWKISPERQNRDRVLALCETQSDLDSKLKAVNLYTNNFRSIGSRHFSCLRNLEELKWVDSHIERVEDFTFNSTSLLKTLDLSSNKITQLTKYTFYGLPNLKTLLVKDNSLLVVEAVSLLHLTSIEVVSLGVFQYPSSEPSEIQINLRVPETLTNLYISSGIKPMTLILSNSRKLALNLHVCGQSVTFQDCDNTFFQSLVQLTAETEQLRCGQSFPGQFFKSLRHLMIKANRRNAQMDLTDLNQLVNLKTLILFNVDLSHQPGLDVMFHNLSNLEYLHISVCSVSLLEKDLSRDLKSLKVLFLHLDDVLSVMENFVEPLKNLRYLIMKEALLHCSCDNAWITNWAKHQQNVQVYFPQSSLEKLLCITANGTKYLNKYAQEYCFTDVDFFLFVSTFLGLVFFMLVVLLHQLAGDYLLAFFHIAHAWVEEAMRANKKGHYCFDVFVSYCGKDEHWVVDELLPNLEKRGPPFLRLCLHSRDFELGKDIVENITNSLYRSRHTLCLVSCNYLRSNWCSLEMRLGTYRMLAEHRDVLILVFLEKVPRQHLNVHHRLSRVVKTRTYLDWPQDPALQSAFWDRLWAKLSPETTA